jgi:hypothetical protein
MIKWLYQLLCSFLDFVELHQQSYLKLQSRVAPAARLTAQHKPTTGDELQPSAVDEPNRAPPLTNGAKCLPST